MEVGPFGLGIRVEAGLRGESFAPYLVGGTLAVVVELPKPFKDLDVEIALEWRQEATPTVEDPWSGALVEHERCTESWPAAEGGTTADDPGEDAPLVPLDANVLVSFTQPMGDDTGLADNPPATAPTVAIGEHQATYLVAALRLHRIRAALAEGLRHTVESLGHGLVFGLDLGARDHAAGGSDDACLCIAEGQQLGL